MEGQTLLLQTTYELGDDNLRNTRRRPQRRREQHKYIYGRFIRDKQVVVIDHNNENIGLIDTRDALNIARDAGLELVVVSQGKNGKPSTCKVLDFGKYKFEQEKREKAAKKKQRENAVKIKEVKLRPNTEDNDIQTKARQIKEFFDDGNRVKLTVVFRGREMAHREVGLETMNTFAKLISGRFEADPSMSGRQMTAILVKNEQEAKAV